MHHNAAGFDKLKAPGPAPNPNGIAGDGSVRQFWQTSSDGGETWATIWDGHYEKME
jgi:hypothetical protein